MKMWRVMTRDDFDDFPIERSRHRTKDEANAACKPWFAWWGLWVEEFEV